VHAKSRLVEACPRHALTRKARIAIGAETTASMMSIFGSSRQAASNLLVVI